MSLTDRLVMIPSTQPIRLTDIERIEIPLEQGRRVELYRSRTGPIEPAAYALHFIGNADRAESIASLALFDWPGGGVDGYALNYPGYGQSTGPARLKSAAAAGLAAYDWLRTRAGGRPIYVAGSSLGTTVALHVAAERSDVAGLVLHNPPPLRQLIRGRFGWWNLWLAAGPISLGVPAELDSLANAARCRQPAIFILSGSDEVVPLAYQSRVAAAYAGESRQLRRDDAGHNDGLDETAERWLAEQLAWLRSSPTSRPAQNAP